MALSLEGIIVPIITPRIRDKVDYDSLQKVAERAIYAGVGGIFALGTTGEFGALSIPYRKGVIDALVESTLGRVPLLVGVSSQSDSQTWILIDYCNAMEVDCIVAAPEFGSQMKPKEVAARTSVPILLYNNPAIQNGRSLHLDDVEACALDSRFIGIKDSSGDRAYFMKLLTRMKNDEGFRVFQGNERDMAYAKASGASGVVAGTANAFPELFVDAWRTDGSDFTIAAQRDLIRGLSDDYVHALKMSLFDSGLIASPEMWS
jgi:4-hydroxy-tetrahydrodipicolinate synthase